MPEQIRMTIIYVVLIICGIGMVLPFLWMLSTSLMTQSEFNKQERIFIPKETYFEWDNGNQKQKVIFVQNKGKTSIIHLLNSEDKIIEEYKEVPTTQVKKVTKNPSFHWQNYVKAFNKVPFIIYFKNTLLVSFFTLIGVLITSTLAAYAFARMEFFGRDFLFYLFLSMMMVPEPIYLVSSYVLLDKINWLNTYQALIIPWCVNIFTIFLFRQHFKSLPQ